jgi:hypothetical protein
MRRMTWVRRSRWSSSTTTIRARRRYAPVADRVAANHDRVRLRQDELFVEWAYDGIKHGFECNSVASGGDRLLRCRRRRTGCSDRRSCSHRKSGQPAA